MLLHAKSSSRQAEVYFGVDERCQVHIIKREISKKKVRENTARARSASVSVAVTDPLLLASATLSYTSSFHSL